MKLKLCSCYLLLLMMMPAMTFTGCATGYQNPNLPHLASEQEYHDAVSASSSKRQVYDGLYAIMEFTATLLNSKVYRLQVDEGARISQWTEDAYNNKKSEVETNLSKQTEVFLGFYVPERKHDDLHKPSTLWKVFLDVDGHRYEGKVSKIKTIVADVHSLYPYHTRFYTPYKIVFPVPTSQVENSISKLTLTGPVGSSFVEFAPLK